MATMAASSVEAVAPKRWQMWTGRVLSALPILGMVLSGAMKVIQHPKVLEGMHKFGYPDGAIMGIGLLELSCAVVYAIPRTAVLGAILVTGYLGGAVATHVRIGDPFVAPLLLGVFAWAGLFLRDERLRALLPLRETSSRD